MNVLFAEILFIVFSFIITNEKNIHIFISLLLFVPNVTSPAHTRPTAGHYYELLYDEAPSDTMSSTVYTWQPCAVAAGGSRYLRDTFEQLPSLSLADHDLFPCELERTTALASHMMWASLAHSNKYHHHLRQKEGGLATITTLNKRFGERSNAAI